MNAEKDTAARITAYLDHGADDLRAGTAYRLRQARAAALARLDPAYAPEAMPAGELAAAGRARARAGRPGPITPLRLSLLALVVAVGLFGGLEWHAVNQVHELQDLDAQLLASDLPIDAYLDRGFINWLKAESQ
jgi:hypothetical protein